MTDMNAPERTQGSPAAYYELAPLAQEKARQVGLQLFRLGKGTLWVGVREPVRSHMVEQLYAQVEEFGLDCINTAQEHLGLIDEDKL